MTNTTKEESEELTKLVNDNIERYGCHLAILEKDNYMPGFVYSIGLYKRFRHPEIICFGLRSEVASTMINYACELIQQGENMEPGKLYDAFLEGYGVQFVEVAETFYSDYVGYASRFYNDTFNFPLLQLVWPDKASLFPWEEDFNPDWKFKQPLLDRNTDFKFYEERNLGVFTTREVLTGVPILYVYHNADGDWQFHASLEPRLEDSKIVCLEELTNLDSSLNELFNLQYGWRAWRISKRDEWHYEEDYGEE